MENRFMETGDFDDLMEDSELDSARMILRLTSELKEKEQEISALRNKSFDEIRQNNKAKEAEFDALIRGQEARIKKREQEIAQLLVQKESELWKKYQAMLENALDTNRKELEAERLRLLDAASRKDALIAEQKKALRLDMETLFHKWQTEREEDFKAERKAFLDELKSSRETARREAEDRVAQTESLWREKMSQNHAELMASHQLELEELKGRLRQEQLSGQKAQAEKLATEFARKEKQNYENYRRWLEENKNLSEENLAKRASQIEADYSGRLANVEDALRKAEEELAKRKQQWEEKKEELRRNYLAKEEALELAEKKTETDLKEAESVLAQKYAKMEADALAKTEKLKFEMARRNEMIAAEFAENTAALKEQVAAKERFLNDREAKLNAERENINHFRNQVADTIRQREAELTKAFDERYALLKDSFDETLKMKEQEFARKIGEEKKQVEIMSAQKDAALVRVAAITEESEALRKQLDQQESLHRRLEEEEHARFAMQRKKVEEEFAQKAKLMRQQLAEEEANIRSDFEVRMKAEASRVAEQYRIKEAGLAAHRDFMNAQAKELEAQFMSALKAKEEESAENLKKALAGMNSQLESARTANANDQAEIRHNAEEAMISLRAEYEARLKEKDLYSEQQAQIRERQALQTARNEFELERKKAEEAHQLVLRELDNQKRLLEQNLQFAYQGKDAAQELADRLKEEVKNLSEKVEAVENEKQALFQENSTRAADLRWGIEQEFTTKLENIEKNYLSQMADTISRSEDKDRLRQEEYFKKLEFIKEAYNEKLNKELREVEEAHLARENRIRETIEEGCKLKEKTLATRYEQMEKNYASLLSDKGMQLDNDRAMADSVERLKQELEARNKELNAKILKYEQMSEDAQKTLELAVESAKKQFEDDYRMKVSQLDNERAKVKAMLDQEQQLVMDLQKRESSLQANYAAKEEALLKDFKLSRERLESEYQARLKSLGGDSR